MFTFCTSVLAVAGTFDAIIMAHKGPIVKKWGKCMLKYDYHAVWLIRGLNVLQHDLWSY
jgi:hypothetical protein